jgi:hypothetical protein
LDAGPVPGDAVVDAGPVDAAPDRGPDVVAIHDACAPSSRPEVCDGLDNNCNGAVDEGACADGCVGISRNGAGYMLCYGASQRRSWREGETQCTNRGMHLARVDDAAQNTWIRSLANDAGYTGSVWLGGVDSNDNGTWAWIDGVQFWMGGRNGRPVAGRYSNWEDGEPFNTQIQQDCLAMGPQTDTWRDAECGIRTAFFCQGPMR